MSHKNVTCVCEKNEIRNNKEREKAIQKSSLTSSIQLVLASTVGLSWKKEYFVRLSFINGEAGLRLAILIRRVCVRGRVMTCNMSPCQPQLTEHLPLGPGPSVPSHPAPRTRHLITPLWTRSPAIRPSMFGQVRNLLDIVTWCQVRSSR